MSRRPPAEPVAAASAGTDAPPLAAAPDDGPFGTRQALAVTGAGLAAIIAIVIAVIFAVAGGLRLVDAIVGGAVGCRAQIASRARAYRGRGMARCDAHVRAINELAGAPGAPCPSPAGDHPPASAGVYSRHLAGIGCAPPKPSGP